MNYIPSEYTAITPYLSVSDAAAAMAWYGKHFGATVTFPAFKMDDGRIGHAEIEIDGARLMLSDEFPEMNVTSPTTRGGTTVALLIYVPDADATAEAATNDGATLERPVADQPHGARAGWIIDPWGHRWNVSTHHTDKTVEEIVEGHSPS